MKSSFHSRESFMINTTGLPRELDNAWDRPTRRLTSRTRR
jgi:hypothetical protein